MAFRMAPNRHWMLPVIGGGVLAIILLLLGIFGWLMFRQPMNVPAKTAILVSLSPKQARTVPPAVISKLPPLWQTALQGTSRWHVLLGAYLDASGWHSYTIVPRWRQNEFKQNLKETRFLTALVSDSEPLPLEKTSLRYGDLGSERARVNLHAIPSFTDVDVEDFNLPATFDIRWKRGLFETTLALENPTFQPALKQADLSLIIGSESPTFLKELMVGKWTLDHFLPGPLELNVQLPKNEENMRLEAVYEKPVTTDQAKRLLAGILKNPLIPLTLPDGTVVYEERAQDLQQDAPLNIHQENTDFGSVDLQSNVFRINAGDQPFADAPPSCAGLKPYARLSSAFLDNLFGKLGVSNLNFGVNAVQIGSYNHRLSFCFE